MADNDSLKLWDNMKFNYTESEGDPLLRDAVSEMYNNYYSNEIKMNKCDTILSDDVLIITPQEGILIAMKCLLKDSNDHAIIISPSYQSLYENSLSNKCQISFWKINYNSDTNYFELDFNELNQLIKPNTRMLVVNFPHNPTGFIPSLSQWMNIIQFCKKHDIYLFRFVSNIIRTYIYFKQKQKKV